MDILHFLNVLIGFSLVMLVLSIITSGAAQAALVAFNARTREITNGLAGLLIGVGINQTIDRNYAKAIITGLLTPPDNLDSSDEEEPSDNQVIRWFIASFNWLWAKLSRLISLISTAYAYGAPKNISREELLLLLLRKASTDNDLASNLGFKDDTAGGAPTNTTDAKTKVGQALQAIEKRILQEEVNDPKLSLQTWRTIALNAEVPDIAARVFGRFDDVVDRALDKVSSQGKKYSFIITLPLLLLFWPVNSTDLINRLYVDKALSSTVAGLADTYAKEIKEIPGNIGDGCGIEEQKQRGADISQFEENIKNYTKAEDKTKKEEEQKKLQETQKKSDLCVKKIKDKQAALSEQMYSTLTANGLFGSTSETNKKELFGFEFSPLSPGIFITWVLVSMGSTFWLGVLNKMLGLRSEFSKKLEEQRETRSTTQN